jgi:hypothetical protein
MPIWLEKDIEKRYVSMATALGNICIKMNVMGAKSRPDRLILLKPGGSIWIEFKQPGKGLYPQQAWFQRELHKRQQIVETFDNEHYAIQFTQACMEASRLSGGGGPTFFDPSLFGPAYGSRPRKDVYDAYNIEAPEALRNQQEVAGNRTVESLLQRLAERGGQVGEFLYTYMDDNTRYGQGRKT